MNVHRIATGILTLGIVTHLAAQGVSVSETPISILQEIFIGHSALDAVARWYTISFIVSSVLSAGITDAWEDPATRPKAIKFFLGCVNMIALQAKAKLDSGRRRASDFPALTGETIAASVTTTTVKKENL